MKCIFLRSFIVTSFLTISLSAGTYEIKFWSFNSGGMSSHSTTYELHGTLAQSLVGIEQTSTAYKLESGFWALGEERQMCLVPIIQYLLQ